MENFIFYAVIAYCYFNIICTAIWKQSSYKLNNIFKFEKAYIKSMSTRFLLIA